MFRLALIATGLAICLGPGAGACSDERPTQSALKSAAPQRDVDGMDAEGAPLSRLAIRLGDLTASVAAPAGATRTLRFGATLVHAPGQRFAIAIEPARGPLSERKHVIDSNPHNRLRDYILAADDALLYRSERDGQAEYHALVYVTLKGLVYQCADDKLATARPALLAEAETMLRACRSLRAGALANEPQGQPRGQPKGPP